MKYTMIACLLVFLTVLAFLTGCSSIKYVTVDHGQLVTENNKRVDIVGNPPMNCSYEGSYKVYSGIFMYQDVDGAILLDEFGKGVIRLSGNPICVLSHSEEN